MKRLRTLWETVRSSFWFLPTCLVVAAAALGVILVEVDYRFETNLEESFPRIFAIGASGAQGLLQSIATSMITVAGVTFSVTILILNEASNQYSPRILRNFVRDRRNQFVLGAFLAVFVYCLLVLRAVHDVDDAKFVPSISILVAIVMAMIGIGVLIFFIHHIAYSIQASTILQRAARETMDEIDDLYPEVIGEEFREEPDPVLARELQEPSCWHPVDAMRSGYLAFTAPEAVLEFATKHDTIVRLEYIVGDFVVEGIPLAYVFGEDPLSDKDAGELRRSIAIGPFRTVEQDVGFGIRQLVDIALKALSPSMNDTTTAIMCLDSLTPIIARLIQRKLASPHRHHEGKLRVIAPRPDFEDLLKDCLEQIRQSARGNVSVLHRLVKVVDTVAPLTTDRRRLNALHDQLTMVREVIVSSVPGVADKQRLLAECDNLGILGDG